MVDTCSFLCVLGKVYDSGIGISAEGQRKLFNRFSQVFVFVLMLVCASTCTLLNRFSQPCVCVSCACARARTSLYVVKLSNRFSQDCEYEYQCGCE